MSRFAHLHIPEKYRKVQQRRGLVLLVCFIVLLVAIVPIITLVAIEEAPCCWRASIVVCAVDNCDACGCDYTCDGTADQVQINAAIQDLVTCATGGEALLTEGTFTIDGSIEMEDSTRLQGSGFGTIIEWTEDDNAFYAIVNADQVGGNSKIIIAEMMLDGDEKGRGIFFDEVEDSTIDTVWVQDAQYGIWAEGSARINIVGCTLTSNEAGFNANLLNDSQLSGNFLTQNGNNGGVFNNANRCALAGNTASHNGDYGLYFVGGYGNSLSRNTLSHNSNNGGTQAAIYFGTAAYYGLVGLNEVCYNYDHGIQINATSHITITNNYVWENGQSADNTFDNIVLTWAAFNTITGNTCREISGAPDPRYGINIADAICNTNMVHGNNLYTSGSTGDFNDASASTRFRDNLSNAGAWLVDNESFDNVPSLEKNYEISVTGSNIRFAQSYIAIPHLDQEEIEQLVTTNAGLIRLDPWEDGLRFVLFSSKEEENALAFIETEAKSYLKPVVESFLHTSEDLQVELRSDYRQLDGRVATRSMAVYYLEHPSEFPWAIQDIMEYLEVKQ